MLHDLPNLDSGLVALARTYCLPDRAPLLLFALGRTIGWIAHAIEQYATGELIRPPARYTGPAPKTGTQDLPQCRKLMHSYVCNVKSYSV